VNPFRLDAAFTSCNCKRFGAVLGARKHERFLHHAGAKQVEEERRLEILAHRIDRLRDTDSRCRFPFRD